MLVFDDLDVTNHRNKWNMINKGLWRPMKASKHWFIWWNPRWCSNIMRQILANDRTNKNNIPKKTALAKMMAVTKWIAQNFFTSLYTNLVWWLWLYWIVDESKEIMGSEIISFFLSLHPLFRILKSPSNLAYFYPKEQNICVDTPCRNEVFLT